MGVPRRAQHLRRRYGGVLHGPRDRPPALAPSISPKKTWEGFFGGWAAGFATVVALGYAFDLGVAPWKLSLLGLLLPLAAALGDLAESAMKRRMNIKDASELIPGHGGVLDRLDSILLHRRPGLRLHAGHWV